jgi:hypothetical protein
LATAEKPGIHSKLAAILDELPAIGKDAYNQGLKFSFRSIDAVLNHLNPLLGKHGVFVVPEVKDLALSTKATKSGEAAVAVATVAYHFTADDGSEVVAVSIGEGQDSGDKAVSKAMTMAFKTVLGQVFAIATDDDPDEDSVAPPSPSQQRNATRTKKTESEPPAVAVPPPAAKDDPDPPHRTLEQRRQWTYDAARALDPQSLAALKEKMAAAGIGMDFSKHTEEECANLEDWLAPF